MKKTVQFRKMTGQNEYTWKNIYKKITFLQYVLSRIFISGWTIPLKICKIYFLISNYGIFIFFILFCV